MIGPASDRRLGGRVTIIAADPIRGVATSGWRGRSHSLGIADAVTVLAVDAAAADAAASIIASAVDLPNHPQILRRPARALQEDSDLGDRLVTVDVGALTITEQRMAIERGRAVGEELIDQQRIAAALIVVGEQWCAVEGLPGVVDGRLTGRTEVSDHERVSVPARRRRLTSRP